MAPEDSSDGRELAVTSTTWTWGVMHAGIAGRRWWWHAIGPTLPGRGGFALSKAVAEVRARRALAGLRGQWWYA